MSLSPWICQGVHGAFILGIQEQSGDAAVALMDAGPLGQQVLANMKGTELPGSEKNHGLPLVNIQKIKKLLKMAIGIVDLPSYKMMIFHSSLYVYQRVMRHEFTMNLDD
jgi:hypothetical protein